MAGRDRRDNARRQYDDDDEETHVYCFVPGEGIDVVVLAAYLKRWVDGTATIQPTRHPKDPERIGYTVGASATLNREALEDLLTDTRKWQKEQSTRDFRRAPYDYAESDTFQDRKKKGPTPGSTAPKLAKPRDRRAPAADASAARSAQPDLGRGRHADLDVDKPPPYGQSQGYERERARARASSRSPSPVGRGGQERAGQERGGQERGGQERGGPERGGPEHPDPDSFRNLSITDEQNRPNQGALRGTTAGGRHAPATTGTTSEKTRYVLQKDTGNNNDPGKKGSRHDDRRN